MTDTPNPVILDPAKLKTGNGDPAPRDVPTLGLSHYYPGGNRCPANVNHHASPSTTRQEKRHGKKRENGGRNDHLRLPARPQAPWGPTSCYRGRTDTT